MREVPGLIKAEFKKYPDYSRAKNLTRSVFDISIPAAMRSLISGDTELPLLTSHLLREQLRTNPSWDTCLIFVTNILKQVAKDPEKYAQDTVNSTRNTRHYDERRLGSTGIMFHGQYSDDPLHNIFNSLGYGLIWAQERNRYEDVDLTDKVIGTFSVKNDLGAYLTGDSASELVQPALVLNSAIRGVLVTYDLAGSDRSGRYFWLTQSDNSATLSILEHNRIKDKKIEQSNTRDLSVKDFHQVASAIIDEKGEIEIDGPERFREVLNASNNRSAQ